MWSLDWFGRFGEYVGHAGQDSIFLDKASDAQEFITRLAVNLFPPGQLQWRKTRWLPRTKTEVSEVGGTGHVFSAWSIGCSRMEDYQLWSLGTINKQFMKDYRAALVTARVNFYAISAFLAVYQEFNETCLGGWSMWLIHWSCRLLCDFNEMTLWLGDVFRSQKWCSWIFRAAWRPMVLSFCEWTASIIPMIPREVHRPNLNLLPFSTGEKWQVKTSGEKQRLVWHGYL